MDNITNGPPRPRRSGARIAAVVAATLIGLLSLGTLAGAGGLLWAAGERDEQGYLSTDAERFTTDTHAIATDNLDVDLAGLDPVASDELLGKARVRVVANGDQPVFVGIARTADVSKYLRGTAHALVEDIDSSPFAADYRTLDGARTPAAPGKQGFWAASAKGSGTQNLVWNVRDGQWSVVVMNADGSAGVDADVSAGARISWVDEAGWIVAGIGLVLLALAVGLLYAGVRPARPAASAPASREWVQVHA